MIERFLKLQDYVQPDTKECERSTVHLVQNYELEILTDISSLMKFVGNGITDPGPIVKIWWRPPFDCLKKCCRYNRGFRFSCRLIVLCSIILKSSLIFPIFDHSHNRPSLPREGLDILDAQEIPLQLFQLV